MMLRAVIFDLDGVLTDTAEYHYLAWKRLADEEDLAFDRAANEQLRGVARRESLLQILKGRPASEEHIQEMMVRKNSYYQEMLHQISPADLLPGVADLLARLDEAGIPYGVASASKNAGDVVTRLGIGERLSVIADGHSVARQKPAPDLFRLAAARLGQPAGQCLVVEDAAAGIVAALAAGMPALALGPEERFAEVDGRFAHRVDLQGIALEELETAVQPDLSPSTRGWIVHENGFDPSTQHHKETIFTIGNGYFCSRGSFEEGYPGQSALTFAHGIFDDVPISFTELANLPNWLDLRLTVDGHTFRLDQGELLHFQRQLDLYTGILQRHVLWQAPNGAVLDLFFERFASYAKEHVGAIRLLVTAVNRSCTIKVDAGINGHVANSDLLHWHHLDQGQNDRGVIWLHSRTRHSGLELASAALIHTTATSSIFCQDCPGQPTLTFSASLSPGQTLQVDKLTCYVSSRDLFPADPVTVAQKLCGHRDYEAEKQLHLEKWREVWEALDVIIEGDHEAQLSIRFSLFQLQIAAPQLDSRVSIGAKTLSGLGYRGHVFWDTEIFILPFFTYTQPRIARNLLMYRYHTLDGARRKAAANGFSGAQFAWESATTGDEVTPTWVPHFADKTRLVRIWTGDIEVHITADIAYAIMQYWQVTGDDEFMLNYGAEIILDTARFWGDRVEAEQDEDGNLRYAIRDVIGPDEYHEHVDNNAYTNYIVRWHLQTAVDLQQWLQQHHPQQAQRVLAKLDLQPAQFNHWRNVIKYIIIPLSTDVGLFTQFDGFFDLHAVDWTQYLGRTKSMQELLGIEGANQHQVIKQADVIMLLCLFRDHFDQQTWQINWDTYMPLTDHSYGSSLGPSFHAWAACEMEKPEEAYEHFMLAARADLRNIRGNAGDGIHAASAGGLWQAIVFGFAGLRLHEDGYTLAPCLPDHWQRLAFKITQRGQPHFIDIQTQKEVRQT
jgi:kojibiose phosphorylase